MMVRIFTMWLQLFNLYSYYAAAVATFQFSMAYYNVSEDSGVVSVCLELVSGILTKDVTIEVVILDNTGFSGCELTTSPFQAL